MDKNKKESTVNRDNKWEVKTQQTINNVHSCEQFQVVLSEC